MSMPRVAIVYLSYNTRPYLKEVMESVAGLSYPKECLDWMIVDNNSPDNSAALIQERVLPESGKTLPNVTFFAEKENHGFAKGNNLAVDHAIKQGFDYIFLLNNDAKLHPEAITHAVKMAESDESIGSVQSLMLLWQDEEVVNSTGGIVHFLGFGFVRDNGMKWDEVKHLRTNGEEIAYASGAAVLYRASALKRVGNLDEYLFLYHEDLDLGWRLRLAGYKNVLSTESIVYHHYEFKRSIKKFFWMERNRWLVHLSNLRTGTIILLLPFLLLLEVALMFFGLKGGWLKEKVRVYKELLNPQMWHQLMKRRRHAASVRAVSDATIVSLFSPTIAHQETKQFLVDRVGNPILSFVWGIIKGLIRW